MKKPREIDVVKVRCCPAGNAHRDLSRRATGSSHCYYDPVRVMVLKDAKLGLYAFHPPDEYSGHQVGACEHLLTHGGQAGLPVVRHRICEHDVTEVLVFFGESILEEPA